MRPFNILQGSAVLMASCLCFHERELNKTIKLQSPREELNVTLSNSVLRCSITEPQRLFRNLAAIPGLLTSTSPAYCHDHGLSGRAYLNAESEALRFSSLWGAKLLLCPTIREKGRKKIILYFTLCSINHLYLLKACVITSFINLETLS